MVEQNCSAKLEATVNDGKQKLDEALALANAILGNL
jgi:hypothetical protein